MTKNIILCLSLVISVIIGLSSCDDETTAGYTFVTNYASIEMNGDDQVFVEMGSTYTDAGCTATMEGEDVTDNVITENTVNTSEEGTYTVTYSITNEDGYTASATRTIYVANADNTPSAISNGLYTVQDGTFRTYKGSDTPFSGYKILIYQVSPGIFSISDFLGGYYDQYNGYGSDYAMTGTFQLNDDNTITPLTSLVPGWGDSLDYLKNSSVDSSTGEITYDLGYVGSAMNFHVILKF